MHVWKAIRSLEIIAQKERHQAGLLVQCAIACCALHNICEVHQDAFDKQRLVERHLFQDHPVQEGHYQLGLQHLPYLMLSDYLDAN